MAGQLGTDTYNGDESFVVAIDLGTTHTAVSFTHMSPGDKANIRIVNQWPGQVEAMGQGKIPSIIAYQDGEAKKFGAEAVDCLDDPAYEVARWFKLQLHPNTMQNAESMAMEIPDLPDGTTLPSIYTDFLRYIFQCTRRFFEDTTPNGTGIWERIKDKIIILAIPNGWDTTQQAFLRHVAIKAGLVTEDDADLLLEFVTEGEASVHFALDHTQSHTWLAPGTIFAVTDAGGSTVDSTLYRCKELDPKLILEEVCASECVQAGGVFVDRAARSLLEDKLKDSEVFGTKSIINDMVTKFESKTKRLFDGNQNANPIEFGGRNDIDRKFQIFQGKITLNKEETTRIFDNVIASIIGSCSNLMGGHAVRHLLLVGGFGDSKYLRKKLREKFGPEGIEVVCIEEPSRKAAAEGSTIWYTKQLVSARVARFYIGTNCSTLYNPIDPEHLQRRTHTYKSEDGRTHIKGAFQTFVQKGLLMKQDFQVEHPFCSIFGEKPKDLGTYMTFLFAWDGNKPTNWFRDIQGDILPEMRPLCILVADLTSLTSSAIQQRGPTGKTYWVVVFAIVITFGGTKLQARIQWEENGKICEGPVSVVRGSIE